MTTDDIRRALLQQRRLFGSNEVFAEALGVSGSALSRFLSGRGHADAPRSDCKIIAALGVEVESRRVQITRTVRTFKLKDEI